MSAFSMTIRAFTLLLISSLLGQAISADKKCYNIDGSDADDTQRPCNPTAEVSACCATNKQDGDVCLSSGLCYSQYGQYQGFIYSNGCTDSSGKSKECPHVCPDRTNDWNGGDSVAAWNVLQCNLTTFCCRHVDDGGNCCNDPSAVVNDFFPGTLVLASLATSTFTGTASTSSAPATGPAASSHRPTQAQGSQAGEACPADRTAIVGGAVGGVLGAALLGSLGVIALLLRRNARVPTPGEKGYMSPHESVPIKGMQATYELYQDPVRHEL